MKNYGLDLCDLLLLNFFVRPLPAYQIVADYVGLTEKEIRDKHTEVNELAGEVRNESLLEIRLPEATLTCILNACRICKSAFLFMDQE